MVGTQGKYTTDQVTEFLRDLVVSRLADVLGAAGMSLLDMATHYEQIASAARAKVAADFSKYGLELVDFFINAITPPDEVQQAIDARSSMGAVGDLNAFMKFQAAQSMAKMAAARGRRRCGFDDGHGHGSRIRHDDARHDSRRDDERHADTLRNRPPPAGSVVPPLRRATLLPLPPVPAAAPAAVGVAAPTFQRPPRAR